ncbi:MAG: RraA family protein [Oscillospiraceae bacterium]|nr:RraA family protein [Oscillospiraceae bacterium]
MPEFNPPLTFDPFPISDAELLDRYEKAFTAAVSDVLHRDYRLNNQILPSNIKPLAPGARAAGIAFTVKGYPSHVSERGSDPNSRRAKMFEEIEKDTIVVWDTSGDEENAQYGEMMSAATMMRGCRGGIVDGGARDTDRIIEMGFKVWCRYTTPASMAARHEILGWQLPIKIGKVEINPGDVIFADNDGIIVVPRGIAYDVLLKIETIAATEKGWREIIASGLSPSEVVRRGGKF